MENLSFCQLIKRLTNWSLKAVNYNEPLTMLLQFETIALSGKNVAGFGIQEG